jgi:hypothetical protein
MNKQHKRFDISKMTEFKPSKIGLFTNKSNMGKERDMKEEMHEDLEGNKQMVKSFNLID